MRGVLKLIFNDSEIISNNTDYISWICNYFILSIFRIWFFFLFHKNVFEIVRKTRHSFKEEAKVAEHRYTYSTAKPASNVRGKLKISET